MNNARSLAKIMFAGLAVYFFISFARSLIFAISMIIHTMKNFDAEYAVMLTVSIIISVLYLGALIYFLIYKRDKLAQKLFPDDAESGQTPAPGINLTSAYRLICFGAGFFCIYYFFISLSNSLSNIQYLKLSRAGSPSILTYFKSYFSTLFPPSIALLLGIYLLCGAPHFVRWQVKKTLKLCSQSDSNNPRIEKVFREIK